MSTPRVIHVRLFRRRFWEAFETKGVEPFYLEKRQAVDYAIHRGRLGNATVRIYDGQGALEREIGGGWQGHVFILYLISFPKCFPWEALLSARIGGNIAAMRARFVKLLRWECPEKPSLRPPNQATL